MYGIVNLSTRVNKMFEHYANVPFDFNIKLTVHLVNQLFSNKDNPH